MFDCGKCGRLFSIKRSVSVHSRQCKGKKICRFCQGFIPFGIKKTDFCSKECRKKNFKQSCYSQTISREEIEKCVLNSKTMGEAAVKSGFSYRTFKKWATKYNLYKPAKFRNTIEFPLNEILEGKYPAYSGSHISRRLILEGIKKYVCENCGIFDWKNKHLTLELNHKNGNNSDHRLDNLELLCPNCHSQTPTYRSKKIKWMRARAAEENRLENGNTSTGIVSSNLTASSERKTE